MKAQVNLIIFLSCMFILNMTAQNTLELGMQGKTGNVKSASPRFDFLDTTSVNLDGQENGRLEVYYGEQNTENTYTLASSIHSGWVGANLAGFSTIGFRNRLDNSVLNGLQIHGLYGIGIQGAIPTEEIQVNGAGLVNALTYEGAEWSGSGNSKMLNTLFGGRPRSLFTFKDGGNSTSTGVWLQVGDEVPEGQPFFNIKDDEAQDIFTINRTTASIETLVDLGENIGSSSKSLTIYGKPRFNIGRGSEGAILTAGTLNGVEGAMRWNNRTMNEVSRVESQSFDSGDDWQDVTDWTRWFYAERLDYFLIRASANPKLDSGSGLDPFEMRVYMEYDCGADDPLETITVEPDVEGSSHNNRFTMPYLLLDLCNCDGQARAKLQIRNTGNDPWSVTTPSLTVRKY